MTLNKTKGAQDSSLMLCYFSVGWPNSDELIRLRNLVNRRL